MNNAIWFLTKLMVHVQLGYKILSHDFPFYSFMLSILLKLFILRRRELSIFSQKYPRFLS